MSDPFSNGQVVSASRQLLQILCEFEHPTVLSTKNVTELCSEETLAILKKFKHLVIQISLASTESVAHRIEPHAPSIQERLGVLKLLEGEGIVTMARVQPLLPNQVEAVASELIPRLGEAGVKHVIVEFLKLPVERKISKTAQFIRDLGWDVEKYYHDAHAIRTGREWVLPPAHKWECLQGVIAAIHAHGMTYGAGDYGLNHLGDTDCCCGLDRVEGFSNHLRSTIPYRIRKREGSTIYWGDERRFPLPGNSIREYLNSNCRAEGCYTLYDYLRLKWNRPHTDNAPDTFLGVSWSGQKDDAGNCIYIYDQP